MSSTPINDFRGEYRWLSNFHAVEVTLDGEVYPSTEHAYQAAKFPLGSVLRASVRSAPTCRDAKRLGRSPGMRSNWDNVKLGIMGNLLRQKFAPGSELAGKLLATGDRPLVEGNTWGDRFWGVCGGVGENHLGKLLMQIRAELKPSEDMP